MPLTREKKRRLFRLWVIGLPVALLVVGGVFYFLWSPAVSAPQEVAQPPIVEQVVHPTDLQQMQEWFGPWELAAPDTNGSALVMLRADGSAEVSSWTVPVNEQWRESQPFEVQTQTADDQGVKLRTNSGRVYTLSWDQPFVFQSRPEQVYAYTRSGMEWRLVTIITEQAHRLGRHI